jgi:7-cyano-7-deazaguanine reductase
LTLYNRGVSSIAPALPILITVGRSSFQASPQPESPVATAEGRTIPFTGPEAIDVGVLETFPYEGPDQEIVTETDEFSAVCPFSGLPDQARLTLRYVPSDRCVELKSLKY